MKKLFVLLTILLSFSVFSTEKQLSPELDILDSEVATVETAELSSEGLIL